MLSQSSFFRRLVIASLLLALLPGATARAGPSIAEPFRDYYRQHDGLRLLGYPLSDLAQSSGYLAQYFEKGRIEDHRNEVSDPTWAFMYGRLTAELMQRAPDRAVSATNISYSTLATASVYRHDPPPGFSGGVAPSSESFSVFGQTWGSVFIPYDPQLRPSQGFVVPLFFWNYMNRADLFPAGWLHDTGLPMSMALMVEANKGGELRQIILQPFERTVLTYDPKNPAGWQVERGNIGADLLRAMSAEAALIEFPAPASRVTLPVHLMARVGQPGDQITATVRWADGRTLVRSFTALPYNDGGKQVGLVIGNIDDPGGLQQFSSEPVTLELRSVGDDVLAQQTLIFISPDDYETREITLYWVLNETVQPFQARVIRTERIGTAALEELLWGPPRTQIGYTSVLPTPEQVLRYPGRQPNWGPRVTLRQLTIENGVATADFSAELQAYGGGSLRVQLIREQITRTLMQFPTVREVRIAIEGRTEGVLEP